MLCHGCRGRQGHAACGMRLGGLQTFRSQSPNSGPPAGMCIRQLEQRHHAGLSALLLPVPVARILTRSLRATRLLYKGGNIREGPVCIRNPENVSGFFLPNVRHKKRALVQHLPALTPPVLGAAAIPAPAEETVVLMVPDSGMSLFPACTRTDQTALQGTGTACSHRPLLTRAAFVRGLDGQSPSPVCRRRRSLSGSGRTDCPGCTGGGRAREALCPVHQPQAREIQSESLNC